ncbi:hypothetical protein [Nocardia australiensis]|uniref:hypothetical protein n=1 Tax=Nocardia australiensis TaxID=2887191 RepID=UPI001D146C6B|nr:hypothetical protein [Nocardia australiensis]
MRVLIATWDIAGLDLPGADRTDSDSDAAAQRLLETEFRTAAGKLSAGMLARPTPFEVVEQLERLVGDRVPSGQPS